ncbi:hypothetical protein ACFV23_37160, partial [Streptomyces sp. NPDC059627]
GMCWMPWRRPVRRWTCCISAGGAGRSPPWWGGPPPRARGPRQLAKTYHHPLAGPLTLDVHQFSVDTHPDQQLIAYTPPPGSPSQEALRFLLQWSGTARTR